MKQTEEHQDKVTDFGSPCKQVRHKCNMEKMDMRVLLEKKDDKWLIELIAPA